MTPREKEDKEASQCLLATLKKNETDWLNNHSREYRYEAVFPIYVDNTRE